MSAVPPDDRRHGRISRNVRGVAYGHVRMEDAYGRVRRAVAAIGADLFIQSVYSSEFMGEGSLLNVFGEKAGKVDCGILSALLLLGAFKFLFSI